MFSDGEPVKGVHFLLFTPEQQMKVIIIMAGMAVFF